LENNVTKYTELNSIKKRAFLAAYSLCGNITRAAELAEVSRGSHYLWMNEDEAYQLCFNDADQEAIERLEAEARRRAVQGVSKPVFYQGMECGVVQEYSDTLLMFLLKGAKPQKYRDNVAVDANISVTFEQLLKKALESE
jgi:hypothetical protein